MYFLLFVCNLLFSFLGLLLSFIHGDSFIYTFKNFMPLVAFSCLTLLANMIQY